MIAAEEGGDRLSPEELVASTFLLLFAGHETTVNLIGNGMLALLDHPDELERLRRDPSLIDTAVEELLRFTNPVQVPAPRYARQDVELAGVAIPRGGELVVGAGLGQPRRAAVPGPGPAGPVADAQQARGLRLRRALLRGRAAGPDGGARGVPRAPGAVPQGEAGGAQGEGLLAAVNHAAGLAGAPPPARLR